MDFIQHEINKLKSKIEDINFLLQESNNLTDIERQTYFIKQLELSAKIQSLEWVLRSKELEDYKIAASSVQVKLYEEIEVLEAFDRWLESNDDSIQFKEYLNGNVLDSEKKVLTPPSNEIEKFSI